MQPEADSGEASPDAGLENERPCRGGHWSVQLLFSGWSAKGQSLLGSEMMIDSFEWGSRAVCVL